MCTAIKGYVKLFQMSDHSTANASGNANNLPDVAATSGNSASSSSNGDLVIFDN